MAYDVLWAPRAREEMIETLSYIESFFGPEIAAECVIKVDETVDKLALYPRMSPAFGPYGVRKLVVHKHLSLFYRFENGRVDILKVWDNRQDPEHLRL